MIPANDFRRQWRETSADVLASVEEVGKSGWYILGAEVREFEQALAKEWGLTSCVSVASGLDALEISLRALGCRPGDKVLTTPVSAFATTLAIARVGAVPVFADVEADGAGLIDLAECRRYLQTHRATRFFVPVHLYGHCLDMRELTRLRDDFGLIIVEDCAQSIGASRGGVRCGTVGACAATSFYPTKNLGALGDGGAMLTSDDAVAATARCLRDYGQVGKYWHTEIGQNSRLDEIQAAILHRAHLPRLEQWQVRRRSIAQSYFAGIRNPDIRVVSAKTDEEPAWHLFPVLVDAARKPGFLEWMARHRITVTEHYPSAIVDQPVMRQIPHEMFGDCARARAFCASEVSLPIHPYLTDDEVDRVVDVCNAWTATGSSAASAASGSR